MSAEWAKDFQVLTSKTHTEQAIWWLNGFWKKGASEYVEEIWKITHQFLALDLGKPVLYGGKMPDFKENCDLDELNSHRVLEALGETMTVVALRKRLQALDIDNNKRMAISEYLLDKYKKTPLELVRSPQGDVDPVLLAAAVKACDEAGAALDQSSADAEAAAIALRESQKAAADAARAKAEADQTAAQAAEAKAHADDEAGKAARALAAAQAAENIVRAAEAELQAAIDEISSLEKTKADKIAQAQAVIDDPKTSAMKRGVAVQERDSTKAEDPLPLRKAKITQQAALKKVEKARKIAEEETAKAAAAKKVSDDAADAAAKAKHEADEAADAAAAAKQAAEEAAEAAAAAKERADEAKEAAQRALEAAEQALTDLKAKGGEAPMGKLWWMDRVLKEKKKFMK
jgi:hypothetical protein